MKTKNVYGLMWLQMKYYNVILCKRYFSTYWHLNSSQVEVSDI